jgi:diguanylate cyclase (GGDEF)-like protein
VHDGPISDGRRRRDPQPASPAATVERRTFAVPALDVPLPPELVRELEALAASAQPVAIDADLLLARLEAEATVSERWERPLALVLVKVEGLQRIRRSFGEERAREAVERLGARLRRAVRATDAVGYWSPDELALVLPGCFAEGIDAVARRLRDIFAADPVCAVGAGRRRQRLRLHFGGASWSSRAPTVEALCAAAERSLREDAVGRDDSRPGM